MKKKIPPFLVSMIKSHDWTIVKMEVLMPNLELFYGKLAHQQMMLYAQKVGKGKVMNHKRLKQAKWALGGFYDQLSLLALITLCS